MLGVYITKPTAGVNGLTTINRAFYISAGVAAVASVVLSFVYLPGSFAEFDNVRASTWRAPTATRGSSARPPWSSAS